MSGNFSQAPGVALTAAQTKGYVGVHIEQGVPVLDRDLNLLGDLITATVQQVVQRHIGDGTAGKGDLAITSNGNTNDFAIAAGSYLVGGAEVTLAASTTYLTQAVPASVGALPALTTPVATQPNPRLDTVYVDLWVDEIDDSIDPTLGNPSDVGLRTSTRSKSQVVVRVAENAAAPPTPPAGHTFSPLAQLSRPTGAASPGSGTPGSNTITDRRQTGLSFALLAKRMSDIQTVLSPAVVAVAPSHALPGQANPLVITGRNLDLGAMTVMIGATQGVVDTTQTGPTQLVVAVPATTPPGTWPLTVTGLIGSTTAATPIVIDTPPPPPKFAASNATPGQIVPQHAPAGVTPAAQLTLNGSHFLGVNRVTFNATPPVYAVLGGDLLSVTDSVITLRVPAQLATSVGATMTLTVSVDGSTTLQDTTDVLFTVDSLPIPTPAFGPTGSQITTTPASNPVTQTHGGQVTLNGTNFGTSSATTTVRFIGTNTVAAATTDFVSVDQTTIVVKVPTALTVGAAPNNKCRIVVIVQGIQSLPSNDSLTIV
ncbi:MAG TPA: IPT/TIG domain-containing protein [Caulobacteraceae bacterium]|nr:IPT/TIG domain-containing protein [Caulobacteraceae bacterium]